MFDDGKIGALKTNSQAYTLFTWERKIQGSVFPREVVNFLADWRNQFAIRSNDRWAKENVENLNSSDDIHFNFHLISSKFFRFAQRVKNVIYHGFC